MNISRDFHYCQDYEFGKPVCEIDLLTMHFRSSPENFLAHTMYYYRWRTIEKLLNNGLNIENFGLIY